MGVLRLRKTRINSSLWERVREVLGQDLSTAGAASWVLRAAGAGFKLGQSGKFLQTRVVSRHRWRLLPGTHGGEEIGVLLLWARLVLPSRRTHHSE